MFIKVLKSKIHRAVVTHADVNYEGSITLDQELMEAAGLMENEEVHVWDVTNGNRLMTYTMTPAEPGSKVVCINGAAAHLVNVGDQVIIASYAYVDPKEYKQHKPKKVIVSGKNDIKIIKHT
jgi:aspartate 1-decarboxylase